MRANALLVRWGNDPGGWTMVEDADAIEATGIRIEATLGLGHVPTKVEAVRIAQAELARFAAGQEQVTVGVDPDGTGDVPFDDWGIGDLVEVDGVERRVMAIGGGRDSRRPGHIVYAPILDDVVDTPIVRQQRASNKMSKGTGGGSFRAATPLSLFSRQPLSGHAPEECGCSWVHAEANVESLVLTAAASDSVDMTWGTIVEEEGGWTIDSGLLIPPDPTLLYQVNVLCNFQESSGSDPLLGEIQIRDTIVTWQMASTYIPDGRSPSTGATRLADMNPAEFVVSIIAQGITPPATRTVGVYVELFAVATCCTTPYP